MPHSRSHSDSQSTTKPHKEKHKEKKDKKDKSHRKEKKEDKSHKRSHSHSQLVDITTTSFASTVGEATHTDAETPTASPFHKTTATMTLPLPPSHLSTPIPSLLSTSLTPLLLHFLPPPFPPSHLLLSYSNPRLSSEAILPRSGGAHAFVDLTIDLVTFRPDVGSPLEGWTNLVGEGHVGIVVMGVLNAVVNKEGLSKGGWSWDGEGGVWKRKGKELGVGCKVRFLVEKWGGAGAVVTLEGSMKGGKVLKSS